MTDLVCKVVVVVVIVDQVSAHDDVHAPTRVLLDVDTFEVQELRKATQLAFNNSQKAFWPAR